MQREGEKSLFEKVTSPPLCTLPLIAKSFYMRAAGDRCVLIFKILKGSRSFWEKAS
jgi:hypothetical protein